MKIIVKSIVLLLLIVVVGTVDSTLGTLVKNGVATYQMNAALDAQLWMQLYPFFHKVCWFVVVIAGVLLFLKEIKQLINYLKGENKKDENLD